MLAYDSRNERVVAAQNGNGIENPDFYQGGFYTRARTNGIWKDLRAISDLTIAGLVYRNRDNKLWACPPQPGAGLLVYNPDGIFLEERFKDLLPGANNDPEVRCEMVVAANDPDEPIILLIDRRIYVIHPENGSVITTYNNGLQVAPVVAIVSPTANSSYRTGEMIRFQVEITDANGDFRSVDLYDDGRLLTRIWDGSMGTTNVITYQWIPTSVAELTREHTLFAVADDEAGHVTVSSSVKFLYGFTNPIPEIEIEIVAPITGATFERDIVIDALVSNIVGVASVQFYANSNKIGVVTMTNLSRANLVWTNPPPGTNVLTAIVQNYERFATSAPVAIKFVPTQVRPRAQIISPLEGAVGEPMQIVIEFFDQNDDVAVVELFEGNISLKRWEFSPPYPKGTNRVEFTWIPMSYGERMLSVNARDSLGSSFSIGGYRALIQPRSILSLRRLDPVEERRFGLQFRKIPDERFQVMSATSLDLASWEVVGEVGGPEAVVSFDLGVATNAMRFYRLRRVE